MSNSLLSLFLSFAGRLPRAPFWWATLALWLLFAMSFVFLEHTLGHGSTLLLYPVFLWSAAALAVKRLQDRGASGWRLLLALIPIVGPAWLVVTLGFLAGTRGDNQYGEDPLTAQVDYLTVGGGR